MARATIDLSPQPPSRATLLKIIGNTFILSMIAQLAESHVLVEKAGLGVDALQQFIGLVFPGPYEVYSKRMSTGDYWRRREPLFGVQLARKDAGHALDVGERHGVRLNMVQTAVGYLSEVKDGGDVAGMYGAARARAGLKFENGDEGVRLDGGGS